MERPTTNEEGIERGPMRNRLLPRSSEAEPQKREEYYVDERQGPEKAGRRAI